ncbi:MAG: SIMPL domain-containing protein [Proteobacteria bacterium]|nr:SIMPL domain-containing protein [Pseudomonadota bacterium]
MNEGKFRLITALVLGILIGAALVGSAVVIAGGFDRIAAGFSTIAKPDRVVSVRGLSEREVDADLATMRVNFSVTAETLDEAHKLFDERNAEITGYLKSHGLTDADLIPDKPDIEFHKAYTTKETKYNDEGKKIGYDLVQHPSRADISLKILVRTGNLKAVNNAYMHTTDFDGTDKEFYASEPNYDFVNLNAIKPEMIAEATKNAREAAEKFALDSNSAVGKIKQASQGWFSVNDAEEGMEQRKVVRVVTSIDFYIVD